MNFTTKLFNKTTKNKNNSNTNNKKQISIPKNNPLGFKIPKSSIIPKNKIKNIITSMNKQIPKTSNKIVMDPQQEYTKYLQDIKNIKFNTHYTSDLQDVTITFNTPILNHQNVHLIPQDLKYYQEHKLLNQVLSKYVNNTIIRLKIKIRSLNQQCEKYNTIYIITKQEIQQINQKCNQFLQLTMVGDTLYIEDKIIHFVKYILVLTHDKCIPHIQLSGHVLASHIAKYPNEKQIEGPIQIKNKSQIKYLHNEYIVFSYNQNQITNLQYVDTLENQEGNNYVYHIKNIINSDQYNKEKQITDYIIQDEVNNFKNPIFKNMISKNKNKSNKSRYKNKTRYKYREVELDDLPSKIQNENKELLNSNVDNQLLQLTRQDAQLFSEDFNLV